MWDMLYAFGIGTSFAVGIAFGSWLSRMAAKEGRAKWREETRQQHETIVGLLMKKNEVLEAMLMTMKAWILGTDNGNSNEERHPGPDRSAGKGNRREAPAPRPVDSHRHEVDPQGNPDAVTGVETGGVRA